MNSDIFIPLMERWSHNWGPELFCDFLKTLPDIAPPAFEPETTPSYQYISDQRPPGVGPEGVLNTTHCIVGLKASAGRHKSQQELVAEEWEDDMCQRDTLLGLLRSTAETAEDWLKKPDKRKPMRECFSVLNRKMVERMYGERGEELLEAMDTFPETVLPLILQRLKGKEEEVKHTILSRSRMGPNGPYFV